MSEQYLGAFIMKSLLMAAGVGSRLGQSVNGPKCVLDVAGVPLIRHTVKMLQANGVETAVVVGYQKEVVFQALEGLDVQYYVNPFYKVTNSMASLWIAQDFMDGKDDIILGNADVFLEEEILELLCSDQRDAVMLADASRVDKGDYFFQTEAEQIVAYGKELVREDRDCEYVGLAKLKTGFLPGFRERVNQCVEDGIYDLWWENVLYRYTEEFPVYALDVGGRFWGEIDYIEDYARILGYVYERKMKGRWMQ